MKRVVLINDISGIGRCSLGAGIPIVSAIGLQVSPIATAVLTNQTAYSSFYKKNMDNIIDEVTKEWGKLGIQAEGLITGYFTSANQVKSAISFYESIKKSNSYLIVDPIMGEDGKLYPSFDKELCEAIKELTEKADIITPNFTEACILADVDYNALFAKNTDINYLDEILRAFSCLVTPRRAVIVTGIKDTLNNLIYNLLLTSHKANFVKNPLKDGIFSGTGDVFSAVLGGLAVKGYPLNEVFEFACNFVNEAIQNTRPALDKREGLDFEPFLSKLTAF